MCDILLMKQLPLEHSKAPFGTLDSLPLALGRVASASVVERYK